VVNDIRQPGASLDDLPAIRNGRANEFLFCFSIAYKPQGPCKPGETVAIRRQPMAGVLQVNENDGFFPVAIQRQQQPAAWLLE
jgi:hypothetical protein